MKFLHFIGVLSLLLLIASCSSDINNEITKEHVEIGETGIYLIVPNGFEVLHDRNRIEHKLSGSGFSVHHTDESYKNRLDNFEKELADFEPSYVRSEEYVINGMQAKLIHYHITVWGDEKPFVNLIFGNKTRSTVLHGATHLIWIALIEPIMDESMLSFAFKKY